MHAIRNERTGAALVAALALLALAAALLIGASTLARTSARASVTAAAASFAEAEVRRAIASYLTRWDSVADTLSVGGTLLADSSDDSLRTSLPTSTRLRLLRLSASTYALSADCRVGEPGAMLAQRRARLIVQRLLGNNALAPRRAPRAIPRWPLADIN